MKFTGERFIPNTSLDQDLEKEHFQRYEVLKNLCKNKIVLDLASGEGYGTKILSETAKYIYGVDTSFEAISAAEKKYIAENLEYKCGSASNISCIKDKSIDIVVSFETIEHITQEEQNKFLLEIKRVLKEDGILIMSTPDKKIYSDLFNYKNEYHIKEFYKEEFIEFIKSKFKNMRIYSQYQENVLILDEDEKINTYSVKKNCKNLQTKYIIVIASNKDLSDEKYNINSIFHYNEGKNNNMIKRIIELQKEVEDLGKWGKRLDKELMEVKKTEKNLRMEIEKIKNLAGWKLLVKYYKKRDKLFPMDSKRRFFMKLFLKASRNPKYYSKKLNYDNFKKFKYYLKTEDPIRLNSRIENYFENNNSEIEKKEYEVIKTQIKKEKLIFKLYEKPKVSIIIPIYNQWEYTYNCLKSILNNTLNIEYEIIIADDVSQDETKNIKNYVTNINIIRNIKNKGFLLNCNNAAKEARGKYILFLNNDTCVQKEWLNTLINLIEQNDEIGMVGSKLVYENGLLQEAGGIIWQDGSGWNYGRMDNPEKSEYNYVREVDYISGASLMIRKKLWEEIGGFDERYIPAYCEDSDLAFEVRKRGYKVLYQPASVVVHFEGISHGKSTDSGLKKYQIENSKKFYLKWKRELEKQNENAKNVFKARERNYNKKTIVIVDHYVPHYDKDAGSKTTYQYLKLFIEMGFSVKFIGDNFYRHEPYTSELQQMGIEVLYGKHYNKNIKKWIIDNKDNIDFFYMNRPHITEKYIKFVKENTTAKIIYYGHDLHFLREKREYEISKNKEVLKSSFDWEKRELEIISKADISYYPSHLEIEEIKTKNKNLNVKAIPAYVMEVNEAPLEYEKRKNIFFIGGFGHKPNYDAVIWFLEKIFPKILEKNKDIKFIIVGSQMPDNIKKLESDNIIIKGYVSEKELEELYKTTKISIVPLRYGAGIKGKIVEALTKGIPVVTTSVGAEGLRYKEEIFEIADTADEFAEKVLKVYLNKTRAEQLVDRGKEFIKEFYSEKYVKSVIEEDFK